MRILPLLDALHAVLIGSETAAACETWNPCSATAAASLVQLILQLGRLLLNLSRKLLKHSSLRSTCVLTILYFNVFHIQLKWI